MPIKKDIVSKIFHAIGKGLRPAVLSAISKKDPKFKKIVNDLEKSRKQADDVIQKYLDQPSNLSWRKGKK